MIHGHQKNKQYNFPFFLEFWISFKLTNDYGKTIELRTTLPAPNDKFSINDYAELTLVVKTTSIVPIILRALDKTTNLPVLLNGTKSFYLTPKLSQSDVYTLVAQRGKLFSGTNYFCNHIRNIYSEVPLSRLLFNLYLPMCSTLSLFLFFLLLVATKVRRLYVNFMVSNYYEKPIIVKTDMPAPYQSLSIAPHRTVVVEGEVRTRSSVTIRVIDAETNRPLTINGKPFYTVTPEEKKGTLLHLFVPKEIKGTRNKHSFFCN